MNEVRRCLRTCLCLCSCSSFLYESSASRLYSPLGKRKVNDRSIHLIHKARSL